VQSGALPKYAWFVKNRFFLDGCRVLAPMVYAHHVACPRCRSETRPGQKFCAECGLALSTACPNCGTPYEGNPKFCAECGTPLAEAATQPAATPQPARSEPAAERRYVTVLFGDLVGFTTIAEQQDPEAVRDLLSRYFEVAREVIEGYGGSVEKFIGDAVMAVWGAPVAREDDAERAVRAGLELVSRVTKISSGGQQLAMRVGVLSGEAAVVPGRVGEGMVAGDIVNTASRLQSVAPPGVVLVGEPTQQATSAAIAFEPAGDQLLKGKQAPVPAWRALRVVARVGGEGRDQGLEPPFVGRDEELRLLKEQLHAAEREAKLRMVAVSGQAGIGKSRLVWELEKYLDGLAGQTYYLHQGRSPSYGEGVSFWALGEMVRQRARIAEAEDQASTRAKLKATLADFIADPEERRWLEPALGGLLGIDEANWQAREQLFSAWRTFFERISDRGPVVMTFEDLQWADSGLLDFIEHMLEWAHDKPILIVTLARPELLERRPNFGLGHRSFVAMHLEPLPDEAMRELVAGLVPALAQVDLERIVERAEGVPLYAVETVRALADAGHLVRSGSAYELVGELPQLAVPPSLRALIASRLDALDDDDRRLLQDASVVGQVFSAPALAALATRSPDEIDARLRELAHKELVSLETDPRSPERGKYRFTQGLIREICYGTLSKRERRARHLAAAHYFDTLGDDELAGALASHYLEAYRAAPEGDEGAAVAAQARVALRAAADRAARLHSHAQAVAYYEQAMAVTFDEEDLSDLRTRAARSAWTAGQLAKAEEQMRAAIAWDEQHGSKQHGAELAGELAAWLLEASRIDEGMQMLSEALSRLPAEAEATTVLLEGQLARGYCFRGLGEEGLAAVSHALETAERLHIGPPTLQLLITKSWALSLLGRFRESVALLIGAMELADEEDDLFARNRARFNLSSYLTIDDPHRSLQLAREGLAIGEQYGLAIPIASMTGNAASAALMIGAFDEVLRLEAGIGAMHTSLSTFIHGVAAVALALRGDMKLAREKMASVEEQVATAASEQDVAELRYEQAVIALAQARLADARRLGHESRDAYLAQGSLAIVLSGHAAALQADLDALREDLDWLSEYEVLANWLTWATRGLEAGALALEGRTDEAALLYRQVIDEWRRQDLRLDLALTLLERAWLLGDADPDAAAGRDEAQQLFAAMGADTLIARLDAGRAGRGRRAAVTAGRATPRTGAAAGQR
jgi:class 3 adenylate cyclase